MFLMCSGACSYACEVIVQIIRISRYFTDDVSDASKTRNDLISMSSFSSM
jgi:hypothetical protein